MICWPNGEATPGVGLLSGSAPRDSDTCREDTLESATSDGAHCIPRRARIEMEEKRVAAAVGRDGNSGHGGQKLVSTSVLSAAAQHTPHAHPEDFSQCHQTGPLEHRA